LPGSVQLGAALLGAALLGAALLDAVLLVAALLVAVLPAAALLGAALCGTAWAQDGGRGVGTPFYANTFEKMPSAAALTAIGRELFADPALSASGKCSAIHATLHRR